MDLISPTYQNVMGSILNNGEVTIGTLYLKGKIAHNGKVLVFQDPTEMPRVKNWRKSNFEVDSVTYMQDIETAREPVFSLAKLSKTSWALLL